MFLRFACGLCFVFRSENFGLIPQSLSFIFQRVIKFQQESFDIHVSFLEIYNEKAYDLLGPLLLRGSKDTKKLSKVCCLPHFCPKVLIMRYILNKL